jgi:hypothetical protein
MTAMAAEPPIRLDAAATLPGDAARAALAGRAWLPSVRGPATIAVRDGECIDVSRAFPTMRDLCEAPDPAAALRAAHGEPLGALQALLDNTPPDGRDASRPWLLAPCDLQAIKAAGVTFAVSMLERVIEERARGDLQAAAAIRGEVQRLIGDDLSKLRPGSPEAMALKKVLVEQGAWSQYLEVGIGPDAEIFTKAPPMSAVGTGMDAGLHPMSTWNNPEPEVVLAIASSGRVVGAAARQGEGQHRVVRDRAVPALLRRGVLDRRRAFDDRLAGRRRARGLRAARIVLAREDQPRPARPRRSDRLAAPPVSGRRDAVPRHDVRADRGPARARAGLHARLRRPRDDLGAEARRAGEPDAAHGRVRAVDVRSGGLDAQPRGARPARMSAAGHCAGIVTSGSASALPVSMKLKTPIRNENARFDSRSVRSIQYQ